MARACCSATTTSHCRTCWVVVRGAERVAVGIVVRHATDRAVEHLPGRDNLGISGMTQLGTEHHVELRLVREREADVGDTDLKDAAGFLVGIAQRRGQEPIALCR